MTNNVFKLGQKITSKKTGFPAVGKVCGVITSSFWCYTQNIDPNGFKLWNAIYPDWTQKPLYYIFFEKAIKPMTEKECLFAGGTREDWERVPTSHIVAYPQDDLELVV